MSVIKTEVDRKKQKVTYAEGIVEFVKLDKFDEPKTFHWDGKAIVSTHRASILVKEKDANKEDKGVWIGLGDIELKEGYENLQVKSGEDYITIEKGIEVSVDIDKVDERNGNTYYNTKKSRITVVSTEGVQSKSSKGAKTKEPVEKEPFDNTGQIAGHAIGGAASLVEKGFKEDMFTLAKIFHSATAKVKEEVSKISGKGVNTKVVGFSAGNAVNSAVKLISKSEKDIEAFLVSKAVEIYNEVSIPVYDFIANGGKEEKVEKVKEKSTPKESEPPMDFDDNIPF